MRAEMIGVLHRIPAHTVIGALMVATAMLAGGGGSPSPISELMVQLIYAALTCGWLWLAAVPGQPLLPNARGVWILSALALIIPVVQLIPLPPTLWHALPGQADRSAALALVGADQLWHPLSLAPAHTVASLLAINPALLMMIATAALDRRGRAILLSVVATLALASALLGAVQLPLGVAAPRLYAVSNLGVTGFQANKNAAADVLLIGLLAVAAAVAPSLVIEEKTRRERIIADPRAAWVVLGGAALLLVFATVFTNSRAGIALIPVALAGTWLMLAPALPRALRRRWLPIIPLALGALVLAGGTLYSGNSALGTVFRRFAVADQVRRELWHDAWYALRQSWPAGIGVGGAEHALVAAERLEVVDPSAPNRVHNDYLEFALEGGLAAVAVMLGTAAVAFGAAWRGLGRVEERDQVIVGISIIAIVGLHSCVDYPIRSMALACLTGMGAGLLFPSPNSPGRRPDALDRRVMGSQT
ncbi:MAG: O-antigen ligase family protein [Croceibacterium sp.]